jgi:hypothetical protein
MWCHKMRPSLDSSQKQRRRPLTRTTTLLQPLVFTPSKSVHGTDVEASSFQHSVFYFLKFHCFSNMATHLFIQAKFHFFPEIRCIEGTLVSMIDNCGCFSLFPHTMFPIYEHLFVLYQIPIMFCELYHDI